VQRAKLSPTPLAPLSQPGPFLAQGGVVAVAGIHHGVVAIDVEDPAFQAGQEGVELLRSCCPPRTAGEQAVAGDR
jgi:hypothetical protein